MDKSTRAPKAMINLTFSPLLRPVFGSRVIEVPEGAGALAGYQAGFKPLLYGILAALVLTLFLKETRPMAKKS